MFFRIKILITQGWNWCVLWIFSIFTVFDLNYGWSATKIHTDAEKVKPNWRFADSPSTLWWAKGTITDLKTLNPDERMRVGVSPWKRCAIYRLFGSPCRHQRICRGLQSPRQHRKEACSFTDAFHWQYKHSSLGPRVCVHVCVFAFLDEWVSSLTLCVRELWVQCRFTMSFDIETNFQY